MNNTAMTCSQKTKVKMAKALKELMQSTTFDKITVSDITDKCNIHRQTFYYHFQDRYELLDWLLYNELIVPLTDDFTLDNMYSKFFDMFEKMNADKRFYQNALKISSEDLTRYINKIAGDQIFLIIKNLGKQNDLPAPSDDDDLVISEFICYGICGVVLRWAQKGMKESPHEMTQRIHTLITSCKQLAVKRK